MKNHSRFQGILIGAAVTTAAAVMLGTGWAAARTITVDDGISVTLNGQPWRPTDANGNPVELFAYNGTTYAPLRAISDAAGLSVSYDANTRTAQISAPGYTPVVPPNTSTGTTTASTTVTLERAKEIALSDAGVAAANATFFKQMQERENGISIYDIEFYAGTTKYEYEIRMADGAILKKDIDFRGSLSAPANVSNAVGLERAKEIALSDAGVAAANAAYMQAKQDYDDGRLVYDIDFYANNIKYDYEIDGTGAIIQKDLDFYNALMSGGQTTTPVVQQQPVQQQPVQQQPVVQQPVATQQPVQQQPVQQQPVQQQPVQQQPTTNGNYIGATRAQQIAVNRAVGGYVVKCKLDYEDDWGIYVYEVEVRNGRVEWDFEINATSGAIVKAEQDWD